MIKHISELAYMVRPLNFSTRSNLGNSELHLTIPKPNLTQLDQSKT